MQKSSVFQEMKELKAKMAELGKQIISKTFGEKAGERLTVKIGEKGTLNVYGLRKAFPICFYASEVVKLEKLFTNPEFKQFVIDNAESLSKKTEKSAE